MSEDLLLEKSLKNMHRVADMIRNEQYEGNGVYTPVEERVSVTVRAKGIPPMEISSGWMYPPRFTFQDDGPMFDLVHYLEPLGAYDCICKPYDRIINELTKIWVDQVEGIENLMDGSPELLEVRDIYRRYLAWNEKCNRQSSAGDGCTGFGAVCVVSAGGLCIDPRDLESCQDSGTRERADLEMTDEERWKRFEELEKRVEALERFRKVGF